MSKILRLPVGIFLFVVIADQLAKTVALRTLHSDPTHVLGPLDFVLVYNPGVAFGIGSGYAPYLVVVVILVILGVLIKQRSLLTPAILVGVGLVLGGAIGNMIDRLFRSPGGRVVDFIQVGWWPVFNLADAAVVLGAFSLAVAGARSKPGSADEQDSK